MRYSALLILLLSFQSFSQSKKLPKRPKLMVGIVIDQMRYDFLYRYADRFSSNGFNKLIEQGNSCENTFINYLPSYTGPGHACIYTGSVPTLHGIASNDWIDKITGSSVYCTQDDNVTSIGGTSKAGKMSPKNLWASTITDELKLATNFQSKVIAISVKDRGAILPGGHSANASYWMDDSLGVFMTSSHYMKALPTWVQRFNNANHAATYMAKNWSSLYSLNTYQQSTEDNNNYEGKYFGESSPIFPHNLSKLKLSDIKKTPFGNSLVLDFAKSAIEFEGLGNDNITDFLAISFSSTDYVGHQFGPNSIEVEDTYLRLDVDIANLLSYLDLKVGNGNYSLFLTADHGVAHNPQYLLDKKLPAGYFFGNSLKTELNKSLNALYKHDNLIKDVSENYIWLNDFAIDSNKLNRQEIINEVLETTNFHAEIQYAIDMRNILSAVIPQKIKEMAVNGWVSKRSGDILLLLKPGWLDAYSKTGTTHGTWNPYDAHIPLVWYGWGIKKGTTIRDINMTDISATIATLLHIQMPNVCVGDAIEEVIK